jgi:predicted phage terminase large subunit-like protein
LIIQSWDTAFKTGSDNDYSVCTTWGSIGNNIHLIDRWKEKIEFPDLKRTVQAVASRYNPDAVLVEDCASGQSLIQELRRNTRLPIVARKVDRDKESRAWAVTPLIEGGRVYVPEWASWVPDYLNCMASFPTGAHDDDVDSTTQALNYLRYKTNEVFVNNRQVISDWDPLARRAVNSSNNYRVITDWDPLSRQ